MYNDGTFFRVADNYDPNFDSESGGETPPSGFHAPIRGFGKIWRENTSVRDQLGWGTTSEIGGNASMLEFTTGRMVSSTARGDILIFINGADSNQGQWLAVPGQ